MNDIETFLLYIYILYKIIFLYNSRHILYANKYESECESERVCERERVKESFERAKMRFLKKKDEWILCIIYVQITLPLTKK